MYKNKLSRSVSALGLSVAVLMSAGIPMANAATAGSGGVQDTEIVMNGPIDGFKHFGDEGLYNKGGFSYDFIAQGMVPADYTPNSIEVAAGPRENLQWGNYWTLNSSEGNNGTVGVVGSMFYWGGNRTVGDLPIQHFRYKDRDGLYRGFSVQFHKIETINFAPTASPDSASVKVGDEVLLRPLMNDTAGINNVGSWQEIFHAQTFKIQDPTDSKWKRAFTVPNVGVFTSYFDDTEWKTLNPGKDPNSLTEAQYNEYVAMSVYVKFLATNNLDEEPKIPYRFFNGVEPMEAQDPSEGGSGVPVEGGYNPYKINTMGEMGVYVEQNDIDFSDGTTVAKQTDYIVPSICIPGNEFYVDVTITPEEGENPDDWTIDITDTRTDRTWEQRSGENQEIIGKLNPGDDVLWNVISDTPNYVADMTVVSHTGGKLVINYHSDTADFVVPNIIPCSDFDLGTPQMASSFLSYTVTGEPEIPVVPEEPVTPVEEPVIPEEPVTPIEEPVIPEEPVTPVEEPVVLEEAPIVPQVVLKDGGENIPYGMLITFLMGIGASVMLAGKRLVKN